MILVKSIEVEFVDREYWEIAHMLKSEDLSAGRLGAIVSDIAFTKELIRGERFINARGEEVVIGFSKDVEQAIGLPLSVFEKMNISEERLRAAHFKLAQIVNCFASKSRWERFKYFIFGYKK